MKVRRIPRPSGMKLAPLVVAVACIGWAAVVTSIAQAGTKLYPCRPVHQQITYNGKQINFYGPLSRTRRVSCSMARAMSRYVTGHEVVPFIWRGSRWDRPTITATAEQRPDRLHGVHQRRSEDHQGNHCRAGKLEAHLAGQPVVAAPRSRRPEPLRQGGLAQRSLNARPVTSKRFPRGCPHGNAERTPSTAQSCSSSANCGSAFGRNDQCDDAVAKPVRGLRGQRRAAASWRHAERENASRRTL